MKEEGEALPEAEDAAVSLRVLEYGMNPAHYGKLQQPGAYARITGPCGDTDEIFLQVENGKIRQATFTTDGCLFSLAACNAAAHLAVGKTLQQCLAVDQQSILEHLEGLPADHAHCALLASMTLHQAVNTYAFNSEKPPVAGPGPERRLSKSGDRHAGRRGRPFNGQNLL